MKLVRHAWSLAFPALALACQLVDPASDLDDDLGTADAGADAAPDASFCQTGPWAREPA
jgi:hypothetical protein